MNSQQKKRVHTRVSVKQINEWLHSFFAGTQGEGFALGDCRSPIENPRRALSFDTLVSKVIQRYF